MWPCTRLSWAMGFADWCLSERGYAKGVFRSLIFSR